MGAKRKILIVDDDPILRKTLFDILKDKDYAPIIASTGKEALNKIKKETPAVALIDLRLEDISGLKVMKGIRECCPDTQCIVLTGYASTSSAIETVNLGAYSYFQKPYDIEQLLVAIRRAIENLEAEEALRASEGKYRFLFNNMLEGFAYCKIIVDKNNKPVDFEYIEVNDAFEALTGLKKEHVTGKRATKAIPGIKKAHPELFKIYGKVALTGKATNFEIYFEPLKIWLSISVYCPKRGYFVAVFDNITERKWVEKEAQRREDQNALIYKVGQRVSSELELEAVLSEIVSAVRDAFDYHNVMLDMVDEEAGYMVVQSIAGAYKDFFPKDKLMIPIGKGMTGYAAATGKTQVSGDVSQDPHYIRDVEETKSELAIPIKSGKKVLGVLDIQGDKLDAFDEIDINTMETLSTQIAAAIENARLYKQAQQEITERKKAEEELEDIFNLSPDMIAVCTTEGKFLKVNPSWEKVLGYTTKEILDLGWAKLVHPDDVEQTNKKVEKQLKGSPVTNFINRFKCKDGSYKSLEWQATYAKEGIVHATARDITERKEAEEALRKSENRLKGLFETMAEGVVLIDADGQIVQANPAATRIAGLRRSEIEGGAYDSPEWNLLRPDGTKMPQKEMAGPRTMKEKRPIKDLVMGVEKPDGNISWININTSLLKKENDQIDCIILTFADMTKRKKAEEEIRSSREQLRNLAAHLQSAREEERKLIAREIHDELGQTLTALKMDVFWLAKRMPKDQRPFHEKTKSMSKLIDKTIQRIKKISAALRPGLLDYLGLPAAIEWEGEEFQNRTGIKCEMNIDSEDIIMEQDHSTAIFRIFQETLTNAVRHSNATRVKVSLKEKAGKLELRVRDNGKGITEKQVSDPKSFGLIGMRERALFLGGKVKIRGVQDKGTTITTTVPLPKKGKS